MKLDIIILSQLEKIRVESLNNFFVNPLISKATVILLILSIFLIAYKKSRKLGVTLLLSFVVTLLLGEVIIKNIVARPRPFISYGCDVIGKIPSSFSFPSASTGLSFAAWGVFLFRKNKYHIILGLYALTVAFSRIYLGVHYLSDVIAGAVLGLMISYLVSEYEKDIIKE